MTAPANAPHNTPPTVRYDAARYHRNVLLLLGVLFVFRLLTLLMSPLGLHGDEAQYWAWSKDLDWGYFTKPPMIAWVIAATTSVFGDAKWAVRLSSVLLHPITAYVIFQTARAAFDARTGFWAASLYILMPAVWLSSQIVSTDVPLLLAYAVALNAWVHLRQRPSWARAVQLGMAVGLGMLAKYAMLFFLPALAALIVVDTPTRKALLGWKGALAAIIVGAWVAPNMMWNASHDFATLTHTAANANMGGGGLPFHPVELLQFLGDQLGVFGPVSFVIMLAAITYALSGKAGAAARGMALFAAMPLLIICAQALLSRANANWAVTSYVAGSILTARIGVIMWPRVKRWIAAGLVLQTVVGAGLIGVVMSPALTDAVGLSNSVKRLRAWPATVTALDAVIAGGHDGREFQMVAMDKRIVFYDLRYYGLGERLPLYMWMYRAAPENHAELTAPLPATRADGAPILVVNYYDKYEAELRADFARLEPLPPLDIDLGGGKRRVLKLWAGYGYTPTDR